MYSLVLMAAISTAPEAEGFGGSWYNSCTLDSCHPIRYGWKSYGCVLHTPIHIPYGCCGCYGGTWRAGCYGGGCYGYGVGYWHDAASYGAGYSGFGAYGNFGNFGAYSLYPSGASTLNLPKPSGSGNITTPNPSSGTVPGSTPGGSNPGLGGSSILPSPYDPLAPRKETRDARSSEKEMTTASIVVEVPENADVYIDGNKMKATAGRRTFTTPPIEKGQDYFYTVRVVFDDNGKKVEDSQKVTVRGGEDTAASFAYLKRTSPALVGR
jgi:uncharacterized protein (TIGR03000 family)